MMSSTDAARSVNARLIASSQLACVVLFGVLLLRPSPPTSPAIGTAFAVACAAFTASAISVARSAHGMLRAVFAAFALLVLSAAFGELLVLTSIGGAGLTGLREASGLELAVTIAALNGLLVLYAIYALAVERRLAAALEHQMSAELALKMSLEHRVEQRTLELDDAQRVLHRMWWLGQQITLELDPRRVLDRFLEAAADIAQADGAALGLHANDGTIEITAASGSLAPLAGLRLAGAATALDRVIRTGDTWSVMDVHDHPGALSDDWRDALDRPLHGMAIIPVQRRGERIGAVTLATEASHAFSLLEIERVEAMADLLSVALANAELFETMRQAEWRFRTLFRAAPDAVLTVLQASGRVREANDAVRAVFGLDPHQVVGRTLLELVVAEDRALLEGALAKAYAGIQTRVEVHVQSSGGSPRVVALAASRLPEADPPSALLVGRDMTHEREMRVRLMESDRLAAVGELVAGVAHEVNNPLSSISAFAQLLLRDESLTATQRESVDVIRAETMRASQVVKDLLAFARRSEPQRVPIDLNGVVARTLRMRQYQFAEASVRVEQILATELSSVLGDARQLQQVCLNLVTNAVQAMASRGGGRLVVRTTAAEGSVMLEIADTGPGISASARAHIFEPFFTTKSEGEGTGLGLSVSYGIVSAHGGTIEVAETGPEGTTFRVTLPAASARASERLTPNEPMIAAMRSPLAGIRLLFVDDEPALRSGMEAFGRMRGFTVVTAADGVEGLAHTRATGVDAVVCDLRMPGMDGYAFHEQLRAERPGLAARTVFITGDVVMTGSRGGVSRQPVLTKPFSFDRIEDALVAVMRGTPYQPVDPSGHVPAPAQRSSQ
ncbi:MAG TPA: ATP-binding protein [Gemmatimonadaceae bacterium]|jgi:two-component system NtrC family sensor kinase|nr:ATP-binding protein [Gemmatimonadaceae bacterium]